MRQPESHQKCVEISSRAEKPSEHLLANQPKDAAAQNRNANDPRCPCACSLLMRRSHRRTNNNVSAFTKAKRSRDVASSEYLVAIKVARCGNNVVEAGIGAV